MGSAHMWGSHTEGSHTEGSHTWGPYTWVLPSGVRTQVRAARPPEERDGPLSALDAGSVRPSAS
ncbi:hypothetical protein GCM10010348_26720 [Streptomyces anthocyanicus]|nr:hypothetical protein GCM10010348_26720 [Streptomyces anthocyanicus]